MRDESQSSSVEEMGAATHCGQALSEASCLDSVPAQPSLLLALVHFKV